jgi:Holliday junction resolvasome RuvABC ATP-dependent DNA helicase subunit
MALGGTTGMPLADAIRVADRFLYYEQGDISNVVSKGTFLMSVDTNANDLVSA